MRFMMLVKATRETEAGTLPSAELIAAMGKFNEELIKAGVLLAADGLQPSSRGARVFLSGDTRTVADGPFPETKELISGFWIIQAKSKEEAIEWMKRCPNPADSGDAQIEIRRLHDPEDFAAAVASSAEGKAALDAEIAFRDRAGV